MAEVWRPPIGNLPKEINGQDRRDAYGNVFWGYSISGSNEGGASILPTLAAVHNFPGQIEANARLIAAAPDLLEALQKAAETFREYERLHRAKDTVEGHTKANANERMAVMCEAAISKARGQE